MQLNTLRSPCLRYTGSSASPITKRERARHTLSVVENLVRGWLWHGWTLLQAWDDDIASWHRPTDGLDVAVTSIQLGLNNSHSSTRSIWKKLGPFATASRRTPIHQMSLLTPPADQCPRQRQWRRQRQRVTEGTAMAPWNGPNQLGANLTYTGHSIAIYRVHAEHH